MARSRQEFIDGDWYTGDHDGAPIEACDDGAWLDVTPDDMDGVLPDDCYDDDGTYLGAGPDVLERAFRDAVEDELDYYRLADSDDKRYEYRIETLDRSGGVAHAGLRPRLRFSGDVVPPVVHIMRGIRVARVYLAGDTGAVRPAVRAA